MKKTTIFAITFAVIFGGLFYSGANPVKAADNLIPNSSLENANSAGTASVFWEKGRWGTNTAVFTYPVAGKSGKAAKVQLKSRTSGDAKWYFNAVPVEEGKSYTFSDYYTSNVQSYITVEYHYSNGTLKYKDLGILLPPSMDWKKYETLFQIPAGVTSITVFHLINKVGVLTTDEFSLTVAGSGPEPTPAPTPEITQQTYTVVVGDTLSAIGKKLGIAWQDIAALNNMGYPYFLSIGQVLKISASSNTPTPTPAPEDGFNGGFVSLNFDDGWESAFTKAVPVLNSAGYKGTFYVVTEALGWDGFMTSSNVVTLSQQGHEIGAHTRTHPDLTTLSESDLQWEIVGSKNDLNALGIGNVRTFSYPFGSFNNSVLNVVKNNFEGARSTVTLFNTETANKYLLKSVSLTNDTSVTEVKGWIDQARRDGTWLILTFHRIDEENADYYSTTSSDFNAIVNYLKAKNVPVRTNIDGIRLLTN